MTTTAHPTTNMTTLEKHSAARKDSNSSQPYYYKDAKKRISFLDLFTYLFCTVSLVISIYTYYYQLSVENKVFKCNLLENRIETIETQIRILEQQQEPRSTATNNNQQTTSYNKYNNNNQQPHTRHEDEFPDVANVVKKVALQEFGLERLKRDISQLKLTRNRENRQASIQQSPECVCPAGKTNLTFVYFTYMCVVYTDKHP